MSKHDCASLHMVMVRCYTHWFVPFLNNSQTKQAVFEKEADAVAHAEKLVAMKNLDNGKRSYEEVIVMRG